MKFIATLAAALILSAGAAHAQPAPGAPVATAAPDAGEAFLAKNASDPAVKTLPSGLQYKVVRSGPAGPSPKIGDAIKVHYEGKLLSGDVFDSSFERQKPALMMLEDLIPGWVEALPLMHVGDEIVLYTPPSSAYGERDLSPDIPPNSTLIFRVHLLGIGAQQ